MEALIGIAAFFIIGTLVELLFSFGIMGAAELVGRMAGQR